MPITEEELNLYGTEGFDVESPEGDLGWVEEVWLGEENEPRALAVRTSQGQHGLLLPEDVLAVDRENRWVVVPSEPVLLELDTPRLVTGTDEAGGAGLAASWATTGERLRLTRPERGPLPIPFRGRLSAWSASRGETPLWQAVGVLLMSIALIVAFVITLVFVIARLVTGVAY
jgi:hypothetical protein